MEILKLSKRVNKTANKTRSERREGKIPGVIYGKTIGNLMFKISATTLSNELSITGDHGVINFDLEGKKGTAVIKELQKDPLSHKVIHIDLEEVSNDVKMEAEVPIRFTGKELLNTRGLVLQAQKDLVKVSCIPEKLPKHIDVDVSKAEAGTVYSFGDLKIDDGISIVDDLTAVFAAITEEQEDINNESEELES